MIKTNAFVSNFSLLINLVLVAYIFCGSDAPDLKTLNNSGAEKNSVFIENNLMINDTVGIKSKNNSNQYWINTGELNN